MRYLGWMLVLALLVLDEIYQMDHPDNCGIHSHPLPGQVTRSFGSSR
jgi:hypothetical protein